MYIAIFIKILIFSVVFCTDETVVTVNEGTLKGTKEKLPSGLDYFSFKGIPYAEPPLGPLRFKEPKPPLSWEGIRDASKHGHGCIQLQIPLLNRLLNPADTDEDCLFLNIYTKTTHEKRPVMFWIHGGAFISGSGNDDVYKPDKFVEHDVVLVTINYRLGPFGFLSLGTAEVPGNAGVKDQVAALRWVRSNIHKFGGDPEDITVFGHSAGGASVSLILVSPLAKGLFSKAIIQSGSSLADWSYSTDSTEVTEKIFSNFGRDFKTCKEKLDFLQSLPSEKLIEVTDIFSEDNVNHNLIFIPVIEKTFDNVTSFLTKDPLDYIIHGEHSDVPVILGVTAGEGALFIQEDIQNANILNSKENVGVLRDLREKKSSVEIAKLSATIKKFYFEDRNVSESTAMEQLLLQSDVMFIYPMYRLTSILARYNKNPVYFYYYTIEDPKNVVDVVLKGKYAATLPLPAHGAELPVLFGGQLTYASYNDGSTESTISSIMVQLWTNFAKIGNPTPEDSSLGVTWLPISPNKNNYLDLNIPPKANIHFLKERMQMWDKLYVAENLPV